MRRRMLPDRRNQEITARKWICSKQGNPFSESSAYFLKIVNNGTWSSGRTGARPRSSCIRGRFPCIRLHGGSALHIVQHLRLTVLHRICGRTLDGRPQPEWLMRHRWLYLAGCPLSTKVRISFQAVAFIPYSFWSQSPELTFHYPWNISYLLKDLARG